MRLTIVENGAARGPIHLGISPVTLGSGPAADVRIGPGGVHPMHARICSEWLEAIAPCEAGGLALTSGCRRLLVPLVAIRIGSALLYLEEDEASRSVPTRELAFGAVLDRTQLWPSVVVVEGPGTGERLTLREERPYVFGRGPSSDLRVDDPSISRAHLELQRSGDALRARDLGATRGSFLAEHRLAPQRDARWTPHHMIRAGNAVLALSMPGFATPPGSAADVVSRLPEAERVGRDAASSSRPTEDDEPPPSSVVMPDGSLRSVPSQRVEASAAKAEIAEIPIVASPPPARSRRPSPLVVAGGVALALIVAASLATIALLVAC